MISLCVRPVHSLVHYMLSEGGHTRRAPYIQKRAAFLRLLVEIDTLLDGMPFVLLADNAPPHQNPPLLRGHYYLKIDFFMLFFCFGRSRTTI